MRTILAKELYAKVTGQLAEAYEVREAGNMAMELLYHLAGIDRARLAMNEPTSWAIDLEQSIEQAMDRLLKQEPLQHIIGEVEFYGLRLKTDARALIPRPETEELVDWILSENTNFSGRILDIGTGTGCIPIALVKHLPHARVAALDKSPEALSLAKENAQLNEAELSWHQLDVLTEALPGSYELIVSNPPYIPHTDKARMSPNVLEFEPGLALFVDDQEPLIFYKRIAELAWQSLTSNGQLFFEIHEDHGADTLELLRNMGYGSLELRQDMQGKDRMIKAIKP